MSFDLTTYHKKLCALQLIKEHENICWQHKVPLTVPVFHISESMTRMGEWNPSQRKISISEHLIKNYDWDAVVNILKHEMAHQIVTEVFKADCEVAHGQSFQRACEMLRLPDIYRLAEGDLPEAVKKGHQENELPEEYKRVLDKVDKLLSLASSDNESEAALAMEKAHELQQKYNIKQLERLSIANYRYKIIALKKKRTSAQESLVASILQEFYMVYVVHSDSFDAFAGTTYKTIELLGTKENLLNAEYVYYFLMNKIEQLWQSYQQQWRVPGHGKRSYQCGLLDGFRDKLRSMSSLPYPEAKALVVTNDKLLSDFTQLRFPRLRSLTRHRGRMLGWAYGEGMSEGSKIVVSKGISRRDGFLGKLLQ